MKREVKYPDVKFERDYKRAVWYCMRILAKAYEWPDTWHDYEKKCRDRINQMTKETYHSVGHIEPMREALIIYGADPDGEGFYK